MCCPKLVDEVDAALPPAFEELLLPERLDEEDWEVEDAESVDESEDEPE
jgi:hypothetical protein